MIPKVIYFLGIFPFIWRLLEFLSLFIVMYTTLLFPIDKAVPEN